MSRNSMDSQHTHQSTALVAPGEPIEGRQEWDALSQERREALQDFWIAVKRIPAYARLVAALTKDAGVPHRARAWLVVGGAYMVSPVDLVPGVIPVAGQLDDLYVLLLAIRQALRLTPPDVADRHLQQLALDRTMLDDDLATIRRLVRVGITSGARWGRKRLNAVRTRLGTAIANRRGAN